MVRKSTNPISNKSINLEEKIVAKRSTNVALSAGAEEVENNENQGQQPAEEVVTSGEPQEPVEEPAAPGEEATGEAPDLPTNPPAEPQEPVVEPPAEPAPEVPAEPEKKDDGRFNETFVSTGSGYVVNVIRRKRRELGK